MSLVNKMLRDLDARRIGDSDHAAFPAAVTPLAARQEPRGMPWLWLATALAAVVLGAAAWYVTRKPDVPAAVFAAAVPAAPHTPVVSTAPAAPVAPTASAASVATGAARPARTGAPVPLAKAALPSLRLADKLSAASAVAAAEPLRKAPAPELPAASTVPPHPPVVTLAKVPPLPGEARIDKQVRLPSPAELAEIEYRRGVQAQRQGNADEAAGSYRAALEAQPEHAAARQSLAALLIEARHFDEAEELLQKNAASGERSAEFQGFAGALLNRVDRAPEAVERYQAATRLAPNEGRWWAGLGIALEAAGKGAEAREAYQKARGLPGLPADLAQHIEQRLR